MLVLLFDVELGLARLQNVLTDTKFDYLVDSAFDDVYELDFFGLVIFLRKVDVETGKMKFSILFGRA